MKFNLTCTKNVLSILLSIFVAGSGLWAQSVATSEDNEPAVPTVAPLIILEEPEAQDVKEDSPALIENVVKVSDPVIVERPSNQLLFDQGQAAFLAEDYAEAVMKLESVLEKDPTLYEAWRTLGLSYVALGREADAKKLWEQLKDIDPNVPMGYNLLGQTLSSEGDNEQAIELFEKSLSLDPNQFEIRQGLARAYLFMGDREKAIRSLSKLLKEHPERTDVRIDLAWALFENEEFSKSLPHWNQINEIIPGHVGFLIARANVYLLMGMLEEAEADAFAALEVDPDNLESLHILVALSMQYKRPYETLSRLNDLQDKVEGKQNKIKIAEQIAIYMKSVYDVDPGVFSLEQIVQASKEAWDLDREQVTAALFYGEVLVEGKEFTAAADVFNYVLDDLNPHNRRALYGLLETYLGRNLIDEAEKQLVENLRLFNSEDPFRHVYWTRIHFARGDFQLALKALERLEREGARGAVFTLTYRGISPSEFSDVPSVRQLREQVMALKRDGFEFMTVSELPAYLNKKSDPPPAQLDRPWLNRMVKSIEYAWSGEAEENPEILSDYRPDKKVIITFDDGLRNSFRYGTMVANEIDTKFTMFVGVGDIISGKQRYVSNFPEIRDFYKTGRWEIQSRLWDAAQLFPIDKEGEILQLPLPNRLWMEQKNRMETLKEYQDRLRKEFTQSRGVLSKELGIPIEKINAVAYPYGDLGQEKTTNIDLFDVTGVILNEAAIAYDLGFIQNPFGYAMKEDNPMLYKRFEPNRYTSGRYVLRQAYLQHPVYVARRMRAEIAALNGRYDLAMENVALLRRDGYPEEDLRELTKYVDRHLASLVRLPDAVEDTAANESKQEKRNHVKIENPYIGMDGRMVRANDLIDEEEIGVFGGVNLNRRTTLQIRASRGQIDQSFNSATNRVISLSTTRNGTARRTFNQIVNGQNFRVTENSTFTDNLSFQSNVVSQLKYKADFERQEGLLSYIHDSGAFSIFRAGYFTLKPKRRGARKQEEFTYGAEHQWRPFPNMDFVALYNHGVVPSAVEMVSYDQLAFRPILRISDYWQASAVGSFSFYDDKNSFINAELENLWLLSEKLDVWVGLHHSISNTDEDTDLYWTPYWEQRHFAIMEIRRNYPGLTTSLRGHLGFQKEKAREEEVQAFLNLQATAAEQGGFSAGEGPDEDWNKLLGFSANFSKTFDWGLEINASFLVNATKAYTEHNVVGSILYRF